MKIVADINPSLYVESPLLDEANVFHVKAVLAKYCSDGGHIPAQFVVHNRWHERPGIVLESIVNGERWAIQI